MGNNGMESTAEVSIEMELDLLEEKILKAAETIEKLRAEKVRLEAEAEEFLAESEKRRTEAEELRAECAQLRAERGETVSRISKILEKVDALEAL